MRGEEDEAEAHAARGGPGRRPAVVAALAVLTVVIVGVALTTVVVAAAVRTDLIRGRAELVAGRDAVVDGRFADAVTAFEGAQAHFDAAGDRADTWPAAFAARLPLIGRTLDVLRSLADAASTSATAGVVVARGIDELPGGIDGLISSDGSVSVTAMRELERVLAVAERAAISALRTVRATPSTLVPAPVSRARAQAINELETSRDLVRSARVLAGAFPSFAGAAEPRRYLFFAEDPAELRGTGGLWGAFALLDARQGRFSVSGFRPVQTLPAVPPAQVPVPFPEYRRNYGEYGAPAYWVNINMTPDFPSAARAALSAWEATGHQPLDGVIAADPFALRELLRVTGPVRSRLQGVSMNANDVVPFLTNGAFARFTDSAERKVVLGEAARAVIERFLAMDQMAIARIRAIVRSVSEAHLKVYASDPPVQEAFVRGGVDSGMHADGDIAAVIVNAGAGGKIDFYSRRTIRHDVTLVQGGGARATTAITIKNEAPSSGQPRYVIGPFVGRAGDNIPLIAVFCGRGCRLIRAYRDRVPVKLGAGEELGLRFFRDYFTIPSHHERTLTVTTDVPDAWDDAGSKGTYRLTFVGQTTVRPTRAWIRIRAPAGMLFTSGTKGVAIGGEVATWRGVLGDRLELELSLAKEPLLARVWHIVTGTI
jgi:hypothetical protein